MPISHAIDQCPNAIRCDTSLFNLTHNSKAKAKQLNYSVANGIEIETYRIIQWGRFERMKTKINEHYMDCIADVDIL